MLRRLKDRFSFDCGLHSEVGLFSSLLSLLLYEEIINGEIEGVFQTKFQAGPLDFFSKSFYQNRKEKIDEKFLKLSGDGFEEILRNMEKIWNDMEERGKITGVSYTKEGGDIEWEQIFALCKCLGGKKLGKILKRLCDNPAYRSGVPDLIGKNFKFYFSAKTLRIFYTIV